MDKGQFLGPWIHFRVPNQHFIIWNANFMG